MKIATSATVFNDPVGTRLSATYSVIDDDGRVISDNQRYDRVITDSTMKSYAARLLEYAEENIPN